MSSTDRLTTAVIRAYDLARGLLSKQAGVAFGTWGSVSRREIFPLSDIDLLCRCGLDGGSAASSWEAIEQIRSLPSVDLTVIDREDIVDFALSNGTRFHSVFFLRELAGDPILVAELKGAQRCLRLSSALRAFELINVVGSQKTAASTARYNERRWAKINPRGTNAFVRLAQAVQLMSPDLINLNTFETLRVKAEEYNLAIRALDLEWRQALEYRQLEEAALVLGLSRPTCKLKQNTLYALRSKILQEAVCWCQSVCGVRVDLMTTFCEFLGLSLEVPHPDLISGRLSAMMEAFTQINPVILREIGTSKGSDWWIASTLAANPSTPPDILHGLVFECEDARTSYWQTIRLHVARNPNTSRETLRLMLNTSGLRAQDYEAVIANLGERQ